MNEFGDCHREEKDLVALCGAFKVNLVNKSYYIILC